MGRSESVLLVRSPWLPAPISAPSTSPRTFGPLGRSSSLEKTTTPHAAKLAPVDRRHRTGADDNASPARPIACGCRSTSGECSERCCARHCSSERCAANACCEASEHSSDQSASTQPCSHGPFAERTCSKRPAHGKQNSGQTAELHRSRRGGGSARSGDRV